MQDVSGYDLTMCSGVTTFRHGVATGALPGGLVRNPRGISVLPDGSLSGTGPVKALPELRPYRELLSSPSPSPSAIGGSGTPPKTEAGRSQRERGVDAALGAKETGASALARLEKELKQGPLFHERAKAEMGMGQKKPTPKL